MNTCNQCDMDITPSDSNASGLCVHCQEYNYYHGGTSMNVKLFECDFEQRSGEQEYSAKWYVVADDMNQASGYFQTILAEWFGDETVVVDNHVENTWGTLACKIGWIAEARTFNVVNAIETKQYVVTLTPKEVIRD